MLARKKSLFYLLPMMKLKLIADNLENMRGEWMWSVDERMLWRNLDRWNADQVSFWTSRRGKKINFSLKNWKINS